MTPTCSSMPISGSRYPLYSPSVFNFYQPSYQLAGPLTNAGMVAPELQMTNEVQEP